jgi:hypothetical protein
MILSKNIPLNADTFLANIKRDIDHGLQAGDYRALLIRETRLRYPGLIEGLSDHGQNRRGGVRVLADADHIVPRAVWSVLIPPIWNLPGQPPTSPDILSNLFWRTVTYNRGAATRGEAVDLPWILHIKAEAPGKASPAWARQYVEMFLRTKHDEGVNVDVPIDPHRLDQQLVGNDLSEVIAFIQRTRAQRPGMPTGELVKLIEERYPHIRIETAAGRPEIHIG